jgi:DNA-binding transcriptional MocR family regulator
MGIVLNDDGYYERMEAMRFRLARTMKKTIARLEALDIKPWLYPQSGMFLCL